MKFKILPFVVFIVLCRDLSGQDVLSQIESYILLKQKSICQDQVFVHLDRNRYKPNDTIFFQAYIRDRFTNEFESKSASLYALLFDNNRFMVDSSRFRINNATSSGWMAIPAKANPGRYHFVAFTSHMQNFNSSEAFLTDLIVTGEDKTPAQGTFSPDSKHFELKFLPEGGNLILGMEQRICFNATDVSGYPVHIEGLLKNSSGSVIKPVKSGAYGPGMFQCVPEPGMYVEIIGDNIEKRTWKLPDPVTSGIYLSANSVDDRSFYADIQSTSYNNDSLFVVGVMNNSLVFFQNLVMNKRHHFTVKTDQLPSGVASITVLNKSLMPIAQRLIYINPDKHLKINISPQSESYGQGQETELSIVITDGSGHPSKGIFSISVADSITGHAAEIYTPGIESALNYNPYFQRNLPPEVLATGLENLPAEDRDLMLMVYGWNRYNLNFREEEKPVTKFTNYDLIHIKAGDEQKAKHAPLNLDLISLESLSKIHLLADQEGEISLPLDSLSGDTYSIMLTPGSDQNRKVSSAYLNINCNSNYFNDKGLISVQPMIPRKVTTKEKSVTEFHNNDNSIQIPEVTVKGHQRTKPKYQSVYEDRYKNANIRSSSPEILHSSWDLDNAVRKIVPLSSITESGVFLRGGGGKTSFFGRNVGALVVMDGMPLYSDGWRIAKTYPITSITSITVLKGKQGVAIYGLDATGGVIFINTSLHDTTSNPVYTRNAGNILLTPVNIFRTPVEFYNPVPSDLDHDPVIQKGITYYWNPEVSFNEEPVKIKYLNLHHAGPVRITIQGVSFDNLVGSGRSGYIVR